MTDYEYRYAAVRGLERAALKQNNLVNQLYGSHPAWKRVTGDDLVVMTWQELDHVAKVIRDALHQGADWGNVADPAEFSKLGSSERYNPLP